MIKLYDNESGEALGEITEEQLDFLIDQLEEESSEDDDYYINQDTLDMLSEAGASDELLEMLQEAIGDDGEAEIRWERE